MLYHKAIGIPKDIKFKVKDFICRLSNRKLVLSEHAKEALSEERYSQAIIDRINAYSLTYSDVFEVVEYGEIEKLGVRFNLNNDVDIVLIVNCYGRIITLWTNNINDTHKTLNKVVYHG